MIITIEKVGGNSLTFCYVWRGKPNEAPPMKEFHTSTGNEEIVFRKAQDWAAQHCVQLTREERPRN